ncbi:cytochrome P450 4C1 [Trichonephila clavata]|uniref:Cytochrome P450 4C1 n=1 Tax=Trichonephila clavata TaxID=2740835 RepID=A0A8X6FU20_TRICU|nr:cytochrome P450 4C1 [Trichonephila clavata]
MYNLEIGSGTKWRGRRKLLTPAFHFSILDEFIPTFQEQSSVLISKLQSLVHEPWVDVVPLITACTLDIICQTAMGVNIDAQSGRNTEYVRAVNEIEEAFMYRVLRPWLYPDFIFKWTAYGRSYDANIRLVKELTRKVLKEKKGRHRVEVDTFMFGGHETTAMSLSWTLYCLGHNPEIQQKVQEELDDIFGSVIDRNIVREDLTKMKYLECVIKESLRLYPVIPFIGRECNEPFRVLGHTVPAGSLCLILICELHLDPESFPEPEKFIPERFLPENRVGRHPYAYVPFSAGPRNCIGQKFAMIEEKIVLANILKKFRVTSLDPKDKVITTPNLTTKNVKPLRLRFEPRKI